MTAIRIAIQLLQIRYDLRPQRIQMNIPDQFLQIAIFLAYDGFVSVLEKLTMAPVPSVIGDRIACQQSSHQPGDTMGAASKQKVGVIG
jgi:hypothetical protein